MKDKVLILDSEEFDVLLSIFEREYKKFKKSTDMALNLEYGFLFESLDLKFNLQKLKE